MVTIPFQCVIFFSLFINVERKKRECGDEPERPDDDVVSVTFRMPVPYKNIRRKFLKEDPMDVC